MISPEQKKLLEDLNSTPYGKAIKAFLDDETSKIDTVVGARTTSREEMIGREIALELVEKLFSFMRSASNPVDRKKINYS
jgi:hypothetical protein